MSDSIESWAKLPEKLALEQIKVTVNIRNFRTQKFTSSPPYSDAVHILRSTGGLYFQRWDVELFFFPRHQDYYGDDIFAAKSRRMIRKEILMHFIAYNCIRRLNCEAAKKMDLKFRVVSFKGSVQALRTGSHT